MAIAQRQDKRARPMSVDRSLSHERGGHTEEEKEASLPRRLFAEVFGTFALVTVAAGADTIAALTDGEVTPVARAVAPALMVMALIYAVGDVSGAHFNPAVTLAFALRRDFPWRLVPAYWAAEFGGALLAAALLRSLFGTVGHLGATQPKHGVGIAFVMEIVLTLLLVTVILGTATRNRLIGPNAAIAVGGHDRTLRAVWPAGERRVNEPGALPRACACRRHDCSLVGLCGRAGGGEPARGRLHLDHAWRAKTDGGRRGGRRRRAHSLVFPRSAAPDIMA